MASQAPLADIEERFFWCAVCHGPFTDPKLLPCLHRYCRHCLDGVIASAKKDSFHCQLCQQKHKIHKEGVDGYKTDFHIKSVVEFLHLQASFREDNVKRCHGCEEVKSVVAYCFKCINFLCDQCYEFHLNNNMVTEHRPHTLNLMNADVRSLTLEKLSSLTEDPRCSTHVKNRVQLCCETCSNLPICVACTYGDHQGHLIHDVKKLARSEREKLKEILSELRKQEAELYGLPKRVETTRQKLEANVKAKIEKMEYEHRRASRRISKEAEENKAELQLRKREIEERKERDCNQVKQECEREMEKVKRRYDRILKEKEVTYGKETKKVEVKHGNMKEKLSAKTDKRNKEFQSFKEKIETNQVQNKQELQKIADHSEQTIIRYDNFTATSSTVLASNDEWTDARCLPDINAASEPLIRDVKREFKELDSLSEIKICDPSLRFVDEVKVTEKEESVIDINGLQGRPVSGITSSEDGHIIITGRMSGTTSHITIINREGEIVRHHQIQRVAGSWGLPYRYCDFLSQSRIATACSSNQVGIYDVSNGKYVKKDVKDININWPGRVTCVATDDENNIYVGGNRRNVLVFDNKLNYQRTLTLPEMIKYPEDMTVHEGHLLICDHSGHQAYAVTMEGQGDNFVYQFTKPDLDGRDCNPMSVCTDSNGYVYVLWQSSGRFLTQYSQDGRQLLTTRRVEGDARRITTMETDDGDKLLIATYSTGNLYIYGLL